MSLATIRTSFLQGSLQELDRFPAEVAARIRARLGGQTMHTILAAQEEWLPVELDVELTAAIAEEVGVDGARAWAHATAAAELQRPLLKPIVGMLRIFGVSPLGCAKVVPRGWDLIYQGCGRMVREATEGDTALLWLQAPPPALTSCPAYLEGTAGAMAVLFDLCGVEGEVLLDHVGPDVMFHLRWATETAALRSTPEVTLAPRAPR